MGSRQHRPLVAICVLCVPAPPLGVSRGTGHQALGCCPWHQGTLARPLTPSPLWLLSQGLEVGRGDGRRTGALEVGKGRPLTLVEVCGKSCGPLPRAPTSWGLRGSGWAKWTDLQGVTSLAPQNAWGSPPPPTWRHWAHAGSAGDRLELVEGCALGAAPLPGVLQGLTGSGQGKWGNDSGVATASQSSLAGALPPRIPQ